MYMRRGQNEGNNYSPHTGSVLFAEPPNWVERSRYSHPVLYAFPSHFSPLSQACVRGMKDTVKSILENARKQQMRKLQQQSDMMDDSDVLIGDHDNEEFDMLVDDGYARNKALPAELSLTPLQIAASEYIGTSLQKYLTIVELLVSYGANIHAASWFTTQPSEHDQAGLDHATAQIRAVATVKDKCLKKIATLEQKPYTQMSDQNARLNDVRLSGKLHMQIKNLNERRRALIEQQLGLKRLCTKTKMVNDSAYVMALKQRQTCNDTALIEAMVRGSRVIQKSIYKAKGIKHVLTEEIVQLIVEYCNGLSNYSIR